jgi:hypothetical protein
MNFDVNEKLKNIVGKICDISEAFYKNGDKIESAATNHVAMTLDQLLDESAFREPMVVKNPEMKLELVLQMINELIDGIEDSIKLRVLLNAQNSLQSIYKLYS